MRCKKTDNIKQLKLSSKTFLELKRNGIEKIEDLLCYQEKDFSQFRHIQHGRLDEIKNAVHAVGFIFPDEDISILMEPEHFLEQDISTLGLPLNPLKALRNAGIYTVGQLILNSANDLKKLPFIEETNLQIIKNAVHAKGERFWDEDEFFLYDRVQNIQIEILLMNQRKIKKTLQELKIENLNLSTRLYNTLKRNHIDNVADLLSYNIISLSKLDGLGYTHLQKIIDVVSQYGYHFSDENSVVLTKSGWIKKKKHKNF